jgi:hypothetical protein
MRKLLALLAATVCMISYSGMNAFGQLASYYYYVGNSAKTAASPKGGGGLAGMNSLCRSGFGKEAHMCSADEFFASASIPSSKTQTVWIQPALHNCLNNGTEIVCQEGGSPSLVTQDMAWACQDNAGDPWTSTSSSNYGTTAVYSSATGWQLTKTPCSDKSYPVACCSPAY